VTTTRSTSHAGPANRPRAAARPRGAARREALLEATLQIVADTGADAVTHRRVAEVAQLPLASTTYYFESKEQLLTAALELAAERDVERLREVADSLLARTPDPSDAVEAIMPSKDEDPTAGRRSLIASYTLLLEAARRPALRELAQRWSDAYVTTVSELLERAGSPQPAADAELLLGAADGLLISHVSTGKPADPAPQLERLAHLLARKRR